MIATTSRNFASFTKLRNGSWGVEGEGLREGSSTTVYKRNGTRQSVTVDRILWTDGTTSIASIVSDRPAPQRQTRHSRTRRACVTGGNCSSFGDSRGCGGYGCDGF